MAEIREAARTAPIDDFIMSLPKGYDSVLGTDCSLSGGESPVSYTHLSILAACCLLLVVAKANQGIGGLL